MEPHLFWLFWSCYFLPVLDRSCLFMMRWSLSFSSAAAAKTWNTNSTSYIDSQPDAIRPPRGVADHSCLTVCGESSSGDLTDGLYSFFRPCLTLVAGSVLVSATARPPLSPMMLLAAREKQSVRHKQQLCPLLVEAKNNIVFTQPCLLSWLYTLSPNTPTFFITATWSY